ncbi:MAG TPA: nitrous oxide-stimulated promoter family protein [Bacteroidetes bacterium]|nr:nitrous oxide-stimulated promoter family protein [Bacteroidota bacterium]
MDRKKARIFREKKTVAEMIRLYCHEHHGTTGKELCADCQALHDYAFLRIKKCVFKEDKPTCKNCTIHCYSQQKKAQIKEIMRYSGPRMMFRSPGLALIHLIDGLKDKSLIEKFLEAREKKNSN